LIQKLKIDISEPMSQV